MEDPGKNIPFEEHRRLQENLAKVVAENERLQQENRLLREKVDFILRRMFGSSSEKLPPGPTRADALFGRGGPSGGKRRGLPPVG
jgi:hypothetical protein